MYGWNEDGQRDWLGGAGCVAVAVAGNIVVSAEHCEGFGDGRTRWIRLRLECETHCLHETLQKNLLSGVDSRATDSSGT